MMIPPLVQIAQIVQKRETIRSKLYPVSRTLLICEPVLLDSMQIDTLDFGHAFVGILR